MTKQLEYCYVGRKPCGCVVGMFIDGGDVKNTMRWFKDFLEEGLTIDRLTIDAAATAYWIKCTHEPEQLDMFEATK